MTICITLYLICKREKESTKKNQELKAIFYGVQKNFSFILSCEGQIVSIKNYLNFFDNMYFMFQLEKRKGVYKKKSGTKSIFYGVQKNFSFFPVLYEYFKL